MKLNKITVALAAALALGSGAAMAAPAFGTPFYINVNAFDDTPAPGTDGLTALIYQIGLNWTATSTFTDTNGDGALSIGDSVVDNGYGTASAYLGADANALIGGENNEGVGFTHQLHFAYDDMAGTVAYNDGAGGILSHYSSGTIRVFNDNNVNGNYTDAGEGEILRLNVVASEGTVANAVIWATVDYVNPNTFFFEPDVDWSSLTVAINTRIDSNVDPDHIPTPGAEPGTWTRTSTLDGSVSFQGANEVPEPGALALLGLGLVGLGAIRRARRAA